MPESDSPSPDRAKASEAPEAAAPNAEPHAPPSSHEDRPMGAILVTSLLAAIILVFWFSMYALNLARS